MSIDPNLSHAVADYAPDALAQALLDVLGAPRAAALVDELAARVHGVDVAPRWAVSTDTENGASWITGEAAEREVAEAILAPGDELVRRRPAYSVPATPWRLAD